jgi:hypothetical protein
MTFPPTQLKKTIKQEDDEKSPILSDSSISPTFSKPMIGKQQIKVLPIYIDILGDDKRSNAAIV